MRFAFLSALIPLFVLAVSATGGLYPITNLGTLGSPYGNSSWGMGINIHGQVVGTGTTAAGEMHAFLYSDGVMTDLGTLGGMYSVGNDVNDSGEVVGLVDAWGVEHAFLYSGGEMHDLGALPDIGGWTAARGINNSGQILIQSQDLGKTLLYSAEAITEIPVPWAHAVAINDAQQIAGSQYQGDVFLYDQVSTTWLGINVWASPTCAINTSGQIAGTRTMDYGNTHGFLYSDGIATDVLSSLDASNWRANGLNDSGQVVGAHGWGGAFMTGVLYSGGFVMDLNDLIEADSGWTLQDAMAINNVGQIVGYGLHDGQETAYLLDLGANFEPLWGDVNADGSINALDISHFVDALTAESGRIQADCNQDHAVNALDISPFVQYLTGGRASTVPEPGTIGMLVAGLILCPRACWFERARH